ncbi:restriction endonuclease subunit S [Oceanivirga salmonicida]|uniref:restriction endonuclease subunit S n=1 Tax=Oceanivirga salmonicida TaxID=1769291 RepID=UPI0012E24F51|nr:restriction endonuclease subunit S [Oceanivirga salmonicida]
MLLLFSNIIAKPLNYTFNGTLSDYCDIKSGFAFKSSDWINDGINVIKIKTINSANSLNLKEFSYVNKDKLEKASNFIVNAGDIIIAMTGATLGKFALIPFMNKKLLVNQRVGKFFFNNINCEKTAFLYCSLLYQPIINQIINKGQGSAQANISASDILSTSCFVPNKNNINKFNEICKPYIIKMTRIQYENIKLEKLRDSLLPKLMSGEIDVSNIAI